MSLSMGDSPPAKRPKIATEIDNLLQERALIVDSICESDMIFLRELLVHSFAISFCPHRDNFYDKLALLDCAMEIINSGADKQKNAICMAHKIQNSLSNEEIRSGWRVSFDTRDGAHRFFYLNDRIREKRVISFRCHLS